MAAGGRRSPGEGATTEHTTGHVWDEDIRELNNPLPRWWLWLFIITVVFGVVYLALYPGLGTFKGTSTDPHEPNTRASRVSTRIASNARWRRLGARGAAELTDPAALNIGRNLFLNNCATCHGSDGGGAPGFPNLADKDWLWAARPTPWLPPSPMAAPASCRRGARCSARAVSRTC